MNTLAKLLLLITSGFICYDIIQRLVVSDEISNKTFLPTLQVETNKENININEQELLEKFIKFDVSWQEEIAATKELTDAETLNNTNNSKTETITLMAIFNYTQPSAVLSYFDNQGHWLKSEAITIKSKLGNYTVEDIKEKQITLTDTQSNSLKLTLFKPTNYLNLMIKTDE